MARSLAGIVAVTCVALTKVVARFEPFHCTMEFETKFVPVAVNVNAAPAAVALEGEMLVSVGAGLLTVNVTAEDTPPPGAGLNTVTLTVAPAARSLAGIAAVSCMALTNVVVRLAPFQRTTELEIKEAPLTVSVVAASPALALEGEMEVMLGRGF